MLLQQKSRKAEKQRQNMFQHGNKAKGTYQGALKIIHWWKYQVSGLQQIRKGSFIGHRCCLMTLLVFGRSYCTLPKGFYPIVTRKDVWSNSEVGNKGLRRKPKTSWQLVPALPHPAFRDPSNSPTESITHVCYRLLLLAFVLLFCVIVLLAFVCVGGVVGGVGISCPIPCSWP